MATRLYLPASGSAPLGSLAVDANWEQTTGLVRLPTSITKSNTALADSARTWASATTQQWCWWQFQSGLLAQGYSWTTGDTVSMVIRGFEGNAQCDDHLAYSIRVVSADGTSVRGTVGLYHATSTELVVTTPTTRIHSARTGGASNFTSYPGDRIIVEIGLHGVTPSTSYTQTLRIGDPSATNDFALTAGLTTDLCPWVELSRDVIFGNARMVGQSDGGLNTNAGTLIGDGQLAGSSDGIALVAGTLVPPGTTEYIKGVVNAPFTISDEFESYNTGVLAGQGSWLNCTNGDIAGISIYDVSGDNQYRTPSVMEAGAMRSETFNDDQFSQITYDGPAATEIGCAIRMSMSVEDYNAFIAYQATSTNRQVYFVVQNNWNVIAEYDSGGASAGDTIRLEIKGNTLTAYRNGSVDTLLGEGAAINGVSGNNGVYNISGLITNQPRLAHGSVGISAFSTAGTAYGDDFIGGNLGYVSGTLHGKVYLNNNIANGAFDSPGAWTLGAGCTISAGIFHSAGVAVPMYQTQAVMPVGMQTLTQYQVKFDIQNCAPGSFFSLNSTDELHVYLSADARYTGTYILVFTTGDDIGTGGVLIHDYSGETWDISYLCLKRTADIPTGVATVSGTLAGKVFLRGSTGPIITDDFERYSTGNLHGQGNWVQGGDNSDAIQVVDVSGDNVVRSGGDSVDQVTYNTAITNPNQFAQVTLGPMGSGQIGLVLRSSGVNSTACYLVYSATTSTRQAAYCINNTWTNYNNGGTVAEGDVLRAEAVGSTFRIFCNGVLDTAVGTGIFTIPTGLETGSPGIHAYSSANSEIDDFVAGAITVIGTLTEAEAVGELIGQSDGVATVSGTLSGKGELCNQVLGTQFITNTTFDTDVSGWSTDMGDLPRDGYSWVGGRLYQNGTAEFRVLEPTGITLVQGTKYRFKFDMDYIGGSLRITRPTTGEIPIEASGHYILSYIDSGSGYFFTTWPGWNGYLDNAYFWTVTGAHGSGVATVTGDLGEASAIIQRAGQSDGVATVSGTLQGKGFLQSNCTGDDVVINGSFTSNADGWDITGDWIWEASGWIAINSGTSGGQSYTPVLTINTWYRIWFTLGGVTAGECGLDAGYTENGTRKNINGTFVEDQYCEVSSYLYVTPSATFRGHVDDIIARPFQCGIATVSGVLIGKTTLAGIINGVATCSGVLLGTGALSDSSSGVATCSATLGGEFLLSGQTNGVSIVSGILQAKGQLTGQASGVTSVSGVLVAKGLLSGQSDGITTISAVLTAKGQLQGVTDGVASVSGSLAPASSTQYISASSTGIATVSATLNGEGALQGTTTSTATVTGIIFGKAQLDGTVEGVSLVSGTIQAKGSLFGTSDGVTTVSGVLLADGRLYGSVDGIATVSGEMLALSSGSLIGTINGVSSVSGILIAEGSLYAVITSIATVSGTINGQVQRTGIIDGVASVSGALTAKGQLTGAITISTANSGILNGKGRLVSSINGVASVSAILVAKGQLAGQSDGIVDVSADLNAEIITVSSSTGIASVSGVLIGKGQLQGQSDGIATLTLIAGGIVPIYGSSDSVATVTGVLLAKGQLQSNINGVATVSGNLQQVTSTQYISGQSDGVSTVSATLLAKGQLQGTVTSIATVSGTMVSLSEGSLIATVNGVSAVSGVLQAEGRLYTTIDSIATVSGTINGEIQKAGIINGIASISGILAGRGQLQGQSDGIVDVSADLNGEEAYVSQSNGVASVSGILVGKGQLQSVIDGIASVSGTFQLGAVTEYVEGVIDGISTVSGILIGKFHLLALTDGVALTGGVLGGSADLTGSLLSAAEVSATLLGGALLSGNTTGIATPSTAGYTVLTPVRTSPAINPTINSLDLQAICYTLIPAGAYHRIVGFLWGEAEDQLINTAYATGSPILLGSSNITVGCTIYELDPNKTYYFRAFSVDQFRGYYESPIIRSAVTSDTQILAAGSSSGAPVVSGVLNGWYQFHGEIFGVASLFGNMYHYIMPELLQGNSIITSVMSANSFIETAINETSLITGTITQNSIVK